MVAAEGSNISDGTSQGTDSGHHTHRTQGDNQLVSLKNVHVSYVYILQIEIYNTYQPILFNILYKNKFKVPFFVRYLYLL